MKVSELVLILNIFVLMIFVSGCLNQGPPPNNIEIKDNAFQPSSTNVPVNATVTWNNHNGQVETVTSKDGSFDSGDIPDGYEFRHTFLQPGTYEYYSSTNKSMTGRIVVGTGASPSQTSNSAATAQKTAPAQTTAAAEKTAESATVWLSAKNIAYNKSEIKVPAGAKVTVHFDNQDNGIPHNFAVYDTSAAKNTIFQGAIITGPKKTTYTFDAPSKAGNYFFRCDVHPTIMTGTFTVMQDSSTAGPASQGTAQTMPQNNMTSAASQGNAGTSSSPQTQVVTSQAASASGQAQASPSLPSSSTGKSPAVMIDITNFHYNPISLRVFAGTTVTWTNYDSVQHTVTSTEGHFDSGPISQGGTFSYNFNELGTFEYFDAIHPYMKGNVNVEYNISSSVPSNPSNISGSVSGNFSKIVQSNLTNPQPGFQQGSQTTNASKSPVSKPILSESKKPAEVVVGLMAKNIAYNTSTITVPAGANVTVNFDNEDKGVPHNFAVYDTSAAKNVIFRGAIVTGIDKTAYHFTAPDKPGTYFFRCDVHPTIMTGKFIVQ